MFHDQIVCLKTNFILTCEILCLFEECFFLRFRRKSHELQKETLSKVSLRCLKEESTITKLVLAYSFDCKPTYKYHLSVSLKVLIRIGPRPGLSITKCNRSKDIPLWPANSNLMTHLTPACEHGLWLIPGFLYYIPWLLPYGSVTLERKWVLLSISSKKSRTSPQSSKDCDHEKISQPVSYIQHIWEVEDFHFPLPLLPRMVCVCVTSASMLCAACA